MGFADITFTNAPFCGNRIDSILMRKNLCSGFVNEEKSHEKELFAEIKSVIFTRPKFTIFLLWIDFLS